MFLRVSIKSSGLVFILAMLELVLGVVSLGVLWWLLSPPLRLKRLGDKIPGRPPWPLVGNALHYHTVGTESIKELAESKEKYGSTFRIWIGPQLHVFLHHPDDVQFLLSSPTLTVKSRVYTVLDKWLGTGLLISSGEAWYRRRKAITPTFHFKVLDDFIPIFSKCSNVLVSCLKEKAGEGPFNITPYVSNCALDSVSESAMGIKMEAQTQPKSLYASTLRELTRSLGEKVNCPWLAVEPLYTLLGRKKKEENSLRILHSLPKKILREKKSIINNNGKEDVSDEYGMKKRKAFLELLLNMNCEAFQSDQDILDEVTTFMFEGHDTSTSALGFTLWLLGKHKEIQEDVYNEVSSLYSENPEPKIEDLQKMKYLERVIKESLRLYPPVPLIGRRLEEDIVMPSNGLTIPKGAEIYVGIAVLHRDPTYFPEPEKFNPDRFLEEQKHPFCYVPFSAGPRNCIGQKFAMLDLKSILSKVILNYKISAEADVILNSEMVLRAIDGPKISLVQR